MVRNTKVEIFDQPYRISGDLEPGYLETLAKYVDAKMREIARSTGTVDTTKVAVLAALSIADELHSLRESSDEKTAALRERAERCIQIIERALQHSS